jgi:hypothetical protein
MSTNFSELPVNPSECVSRQAISRLIKRGRLTTLVVGGHTLVKRAEVVGFEPRPAGRPKADHKK